MSDHRSENELKQTDECSHAVMQALKGVISSAVVPTMVMVDLSMFSACRQVKHEKMLLRQADFVEKAKELNMPQTNCWLSQKTNPFPFLFQYDVAQLLFAKPEYHQKRYWHQRCVNENYSDWTFRDCDLIWDGASRRFPKAFFLDLGWTGNYKLTQATLTHSAPNDYHFVRDP